MNAQALQPFLTKTEVLNYVTTTHKSLKNKVRNNLMPRTLFQFRCIMSMWQRTVPIRPPPLVPYTFKHLFHFGNQGLHPSIEENGVRCPQPGGDNLLHISICCKLFARQVLLTVLKKHDITRLHTANWTCVWLWCHGWEIMDSPDHAPSWQVVCDRHQH